MQYSQLSSYLLILISLLSRYNNSSGQTLMEPYDFHPPLGIPMYLSGNFGELRSNHFHHGIDIKTQQVTGKKVYSVYDGYLSRIKIKSGGYGKSLYITHTNGYVSVYGHLNKFMPEIENYVKKNQYERKSFEVDLYPHKDEFPVKKGQVIALSGNTGRSGGPHLHFEIRDSKDQQPLNVLKFNFDIQDNIDPKIYNVAIYPIDNNSTIDSKNQKLIVEAERINNHYSIKTDKIINVYGKIGFGVEVSDYLDGSNNKCGIYSIDLFINDTLIYTCQLDRLSFDESRYINSHIDYEEKIKNNKKIHKLFLEPNNKLSIYKNLKNRGVYRFMNDAINRIKIFTKDVNQNTSVLTFLVITNSQNIPDNTANINPNFIKTFNYFSPNKYENDEVKIILPKDALYDNINFKYSSITNDTMEYSYIHCIHDEFTALHKNYTLSIKAKNLSEDLYQKALIVFIDKDSNIISQGGEWQDGFVIAKTGTFGNFKILIDTITPEISPLNINNNEKSNIAFSVTDNMSGIKTYNGYIDKEWALFEFDAKSNTLRYYFDKNRISTGNNHHLELFVTDFKDNIGKYSGTFYY